MPNVRPAMLELAERVEEAVNHLDPQLPKDFSVPVWERVTGGLRKQVEVFWKGVRGP